MKCPAVRLAGAIPTRSMAAPPGSVSSEPPWPSGWKPAISACNEAKPPTPPIMSNRQFGSVARPITCTLVEFGPITICKPVLASVNSAVDAEGAISTNGATEAFSNSVVPDSVTLPLALSISVRWPAAL